MRTNGPVQTVGERLVGPRVAHVPHDPAGRKSDVDQQDEGVDDPGRKESRNDVHHGVVSFAGVRLLVEPAMLPIAARRERRRLMTPWAGLVDETGNGKGPRPASAAPARHDRGIQCSGRILAGGGRVAGRSDGAGAAGDNVDAFPFSCRHRPSANILLKALLRSVGCDPRRALVAGQGRHRTLRRVSSRPSRQDQCKRRHGSAHVDVDPRERSAPLAASKSPTGACARCRREAPVEIRDLDAQAVGESARREVPSKTPNLDAVLPRSSSARRSSIPCAGRPSTRFQAPGRPVPRRICCGPGPGKRRRPSAQEP